MTIPERLRDEVLHIVALGRGRFGWHAIASRLSGKDVPRTPELGEVLRQLREQRLAEAVDEADGGVRWRITPEGSAVLSARRTPPSSADFAHKVKIVADVLYTADVLPDALFGPEPEPTPDESAWQAILMDDARFALASGARNPSASAVTADGKALLLEALERARATADWRTFMESLRENAGLRPSIGLYFRGRAWHALGFRALAATLYHRALRLDARDHHIGIVWINALADAEDWDRLSTAIEVIQRDPSAHLELALTVEVAAYRALLARGEWVVPSRHEPIARRISELLAEPGSAEILPSIAASGAIAAALCFDELGVETKARGFAARATRFMPDAGPTWLVRGLIGHRHGSSKAAEHLRMAAQLMPSFVWPRVYLAHLAVLEGRYAECLQWCEEGLGLATTDAVRAALHEWRGLSRAATGGAPLEARTDLEVALVLDPNQPSYRANLAAFDHAAEPSGYELPVSEALRAQAKRAVSSAPLAELAA